MRSFLIIIVAIISVHATAQVKRTKVPSYFGFQVRPVFPTRFIGNPELNLATPTTDTISFATTFKQKIGYSFGGTVRAGITKLIAIETGINFTQRNFDIEMSLPDSNIYASNDLSFIVYDIPVNALFYIRLAEKWYMNASLGASLTFKPTDVAVVTSTGTPNSFIHAGFISSKASFNLNANVGFEFRTEKSGFFYLGGSGTVPFSPLFDLGVLYKYEGIERNLTGKVDGSFLSIDFKYFFPNIKNKGVQFQEGPITQ